MSLLISPEYSAYDEEVHTLGWTSGSDVNEDGSDTFTASIMLALGTGVEKNLGPGNIFLHTAISFLSIRATQSGSELAPFTPIPVNVNLGYKIPFGKKAK